MLPLTILLILLTDVNAKEPDNLDLTSQILDVNKYVRDSLIEGDIIVSRGRNAKICTSYNPHCRWPKSKYTGRVYVPYTFSDSFNFDDRATIRKAMRTFHENTCVRFVARHYQSDYISIEDQGTCSSHVGRYVGKQTLSLATNCMVKGIIQHELLHALGFWHEHSRNDRDRYIKINYENISDGEAHNFDKHDTNNLNTHYDYTSVMHYGKAAFSKNGEDTITPIPDSSVVIGQRDGMSSLDIQKINKLHHCRI